MSIGFNKVVSHLWRMITGFQGILYICAGYYFIYGVSYAIII